MIFKRKMNVYLVLLASAGLLLTACGSGARSSNPGASHSVEAKGQVAEQLINSFMEKLLIPDIHVSASAIAPYVHKSLLDSRGQLDGDTKSFSFKKAHGNARYYAYPVHISRTKRLNTTGVGGISNGTAENGVEVNYWLNKKQGTAGLPAPVTVFFPENGGAPLISYMGSL